MGGGYLSPAAEACYWRYLIQKWAENAKPTADPKEREDWALEPGTPWETYVLTERIVKAAH